MQINRPSRININNARGFLIIGVLALALTLSACAGSKTESVLTPDSAPIIETQAVVVVATEAAQEATPSEPLPSATEAPEISPTLPVVYEEGFWKDLPVFPEELSDRAREIYFEGLALGNDPQVVTKIGDCNSKSPDFLAGFGGRYDLGEDFAYLQPTIDYFKPSFRLPNQTTNPGTTTARILVSLWNNDTCLPNEPMIDCQYRVDNPSIAFILLGTIDAKTHQQQPEVFEQNLRVILDETISRGILPVLVTKADNIEGDHSINATIARLALEYELPLWNFWNAAQELTDGGLLPDGEHLNHWASPPSTDFSLPITMKYGKEVKNLGALKMLHFLMKELPVPNP